MCRFHMVGEKGGSGMVVRLRWKAVFFSLFTVTVTAAVVFGLFAKTAQSARLTAAWQSQTPLITVDAGHGDFDGGAVASDGTKEKDINLAVALPLADVLRLCGCRVAMTRTDDTALCKETDRSIRERKVADMKARLSIFETADLNISIHQNMFSATAYHGAQMFYSTNHPQSQLLAEAVRAQVVAGLQPDNTRALKAGNRDIYLLYKTTKPTVLVECGFLSNAAERDALKSAAYQRQFAFAIASGVMAFVCEEAVA